MLNVQPVVVVVPVLDQTSLEYIDRLMMSVPVQGNNDDVELCRITYDDYLTSEVTLSIQS